MQPLLSLISFCLLRIIASRSGWYLQRAKPTTFSTPNRRSRKGTARLICNYKYLHIIFAYQTSYLSFCKPKKQSKLLQGQLEPVFFPRLSYRGKSDQGGLVRVIGLSTSAVEALAGRQLSSSSLCFCMIPKSYRNFIDMTVDIMRSSIGNNGNMIQALHHSVSRRSCNFRFD